MCDPVLVSNVHGDLEATVYMHPPPGYLYPLFFPNHAFILKKSIASRLKQSPRAWYRKLRDFILSCVVTPVDALRISLDKKLPLICLTLGSVSKHFWFDFRTAVQ